MVALFFDRMPTRPKEVPPVPRIVYRTVAWQVPLPGPSGNGPFRGFHQNGCPS